MTTQGDSATGIGAPSTALFSNAASIGSVLIQFLDQARPKKNPQGRPRGFVDNARTFLSQSRYFAIRTHAPLARHVFYVFFHIDSVDKLALHVGVGKIHGRSKSDLASQVK
jgi:hypothetical protein